MTDSKSIKSNEKTVLEAINEMIFLYCRLSHKERSCKYCFFYLIESDISCQWHGDKRGEGGRRR
jgi:hypothetical protein